MKRSFVVLLVVAAAMFAYAPVVIAGAPYESTMLMVQKIFYFHVPSWYMLGASLLVCGVASTIYLFKGTPSADRIAVSAAELAALFGLFGLVTGSLWGRKAWGVWWQWDARLTTALLLELILFAYLFLRKYGGPGSEKLAAGVALFALADSVIVYKAVDWWRTIHPLTSVVQELPRSSPEMFGAYMYCVAAFFVLFLVLLISRVNLENRRADVDRLYLAAEDLS